MRPSVSLLAPLGAAATLAATCAVLVPTQAMAANGCGLPVVDTNTYAVSTEADLRLLSDACNLTYNVRQLADIDLSSGGAFPPIGTYASPFSSRPFTGTYDGGGHSITGLLVTGTTGFGGVGLFGSIANATIRNLSVSGSVSSPPGHSVGLLAGDASDSSITAVHTSGSVAGSSSAGGIVGQVTQGSITRASSTASVRGPYAGGITGAVSRGSVSDAYATGAISGTSGNYVRLGGIVGDTDSDTPASIDRTYFTGTLAPFPGTPHVSTGGTLGSLTVGAGSVDDIGALATMAGNVWNVDTTGPAGGGSGVGAGQTTAQMKSLSTYTAQGWSIVNGSEAAGSSTWGICPEVNDGYPFLQGRTSSTPCKAQAAAATAAALTVAVLPSRRRVVSGQRLRIAVRVTNTGGTAAESLTSCVRVTPKMTFTATSGARKSGLTACFRVGTVGAGASESRALTVRVMGTRRVTRVITGTAQARGVARVQARAKVVVLPRRGGR